MSKRDPYAYGLSPSQAAKATRRQEAEERQERYDAKVTLLVNAIITKAATNGDFNCGGENVTISREDAEAQAKVILQEEGKARYYYGTRS